MRLKLEYPLYICDIPRLYSHNKLFGNDHRKNGWMNTSRFWKNTLNVSYCGFANVHKPRLSNDDISINITLLILESKIWLLIIHIYLVCHSDVQGKTSNDIFYQYIWQTKLASTACNRKLKIYSLSSLEFHGWSFFGALEILYAFWSMHLSGYYYLLATGMVLYKEDLLPHCHSK